MFSSMLLFLLDEDAESGLVLFLTVAIIISSILLVATVFAYFLIRHRLGHRRRRRRDLQELSLQGPIIEVVMHLCVCVSYLRCLFHFLYLIFVSNEIVLSKILI